MHVLQKAFENTGQVLAAQLCWNRADEEDEEDGRARKKVVLVAEDENENDEDGVKDKLMIPALDRAIATAYTFDPMKPRPKTSAGETILKIEFVADTPRCVPKAKPQSQP
jgi:hypothetical protein